MNSKEAAGLQDQQSPLYKLVKALLVAIMSAAAILTVITHICQIFGVPFYLYAIIGVFSSITVIFLVLGHEISKAVFAAAISQRSVLFALLISCLFSVLLCLVSHRPDQDDLYYVPNVVHYLANPKEPMGFHIHFIDSGSEPFESCHVGTSLPFEYAQGILAYVTRVHLLTVYYFLAPVLFGGMIPLVWFYLISRFSFSPGSAVSGAFFICLSLILMGEQHRSFGNFAFNRIFQGKVVLLAVGVPLFSALTMDFFRSPSGRTWLYLFVLSVAGVGFSASGVVLIPLLALVLAVSCSFCYVSDMRSRFRCGLLYLFTLLYPAVYAASILLFSLPLLSENAPINVGAPATFVENFRLVLAGPATILFLIIGTIPALMFVRKRERNFLIMWIVLLLTFYLNPFICPVMIKYITSPNIYWRLFYLLPFPLVIGLSAAGVVLRLEKKSLKLRRIIIVSALILLSAAHLPASSTSVFRNNTRLGLPGYKTRGLALAREVLALKPPPGTMLAAPFVGGAVAMLSSEHPQMIVRADGIGVWMYMSQRGPQTEAFLRIKASRFLAGNTKQGYFKSFVALVQRYPQIRSVVARRYVAEANNRQLFLFMVKMGFTESRISDNVVLFIRSVGQDGSRAGQS